MKSVKFFCFFVLYALTSQMSLEKLQNIKQESNQKTNIKHGGFRISYGTRGRKSSSKYQRNQNIRRIGYKNQLQKRYKHTKRNSKTSQSRNRNQKRFRMRRCTKSNRQQNKRYRWSHKFLINRYRMKDNYYKIPQKSDENSSNSNEKSSEDQSNEKQDQTSKGFISYKQLYDYLIKFSFKQQHLKQLNLIFQFDIQKILQNFQNVLSQKHISYLKDQQQICENLYKNQFIYNNTLKEYISLYNSLLEQFQYKKIDYFQYYISKKEDQQQEKLFVQWNDQFQKDYSKLDKMYSDLYDQNLQIISVFIEINYNILKFFENLKNPHLYQEIKKDTLQFSYDLQVFQVQQIDKMLFELDFKEDMQVPIYLQDLQNFKLLFNINIFINMYNPEKQQILDIFLTEDLEFQSLLQLMKENKAYIGDDEVWGQLLKVKILWQEDYLLKKQKLHKDIDYWLQDYNKIINMYNGQKKIWIQVLNLIFQKQEGYKDQEFKLIDQFNNFQKQIKQIHSHSQALKDQFYILIQLKDKYQDKFWNIVSDIKNPQINKLIHNIDNNTISQTNQMNEQPSKILIQVEDLLKNNDSQIYLQLVQFQKYLKHFKPQNCQAPEKVFFYEKSKLILKNFISEYKSQLNEKTYQNLQKLLDEWNNNEHQQNKILNKIKSICDDYYSNLNEFNVYKIEWLNIIQKIMKNGIQYKDDLTKLKEQYEKYQSIFNNLINQFNIEFNHIENQVGIIDKLIIQIKDCIQKSNDQILIETFNKYSDNSQNQNIQQIKIVTKDKFQDKDDLKTDRSQKLNQQQTKDYFQLLSMELQQKFLQNDEQYILFPHYLKYNLNELSLFMSADNSISKDIDKHHSLKILESYFQTWLKQWIHFTEIEIYYITTWNQFVYQFKDLKQAIKDQIQNNKEISVSIFEKISQQISEAKDNYKYILDVFDNLQEHKQSLCEQIQEIYEKFELQKSKQNLGKYFNKSETAYVIDKLIGQINVDYQQTNDFMVLENQIKEINDYFKDKKIEVKVSHEEIKQDFTNKKFQSLFQEFQPVNLIHLMEKESVLLKDDVQQENTNITTDKESILKAISHRKKHHHEKEDKQKDLKNIYIQPPESQQQNYIKVYVPEYKDVRLIYKQSPEYEEIMNMYNSNTKDIEYYIDKDKENSQKFQVLQIQAPEYEHIYHQIIKAPEAPENPLIISHQNEMKPPTIHMHLREPSFKEIKFNIKQPEMDVKDFQVKHPDISNLDLKGPSQQILKFDSPPQLNMDPSLEENSTNKQKESNKIVTHQHRHKEHHENNNVIVGMSLSELQKQKHQKNKKEIDDQKEKKHEKIETHKELKKEEKLPQQSQRQEYQIIRYQLFIFFCQKIKSKKW